MFLARIGQSSSVAFCDRNRRDSGDALFLKTLDLLPEDLEFAEEASRSLAYRYQLDAEAAKRTSIETAHLESRAKLLRLPVQL